MSFSASSFDNPSLTALGAAAISPDGTQIVMTKSMYDFTTGQDAWVRDVTTLLGPDAHTHEMYLTRTGGEEFLHMRIDYTRVE